MQKLLLILLVIPGGLFVNVTGPLLVLNGVMMLCASLMVLLLALVIEALVVLLCLLDDVAQCNKIVLGRERATHNRCILPIPIMDTIRGVALDAVCDAARTCVCPGRDQSVLRQVHPQRTADAWRHPAEDMAWEDASAGVPY